VRSRHGRAQSSRGAVTITVAGVALVAVSALYTSADSTAPEDAAPPVASSTPAFTAGPQDSAAPHTSSMPGTSAQPRSTSPARHPRPPSANASSIAPRILPGVPAELHLPALGVHAAVTEIGLDGSLTLVPPSDYTTVGWWAQGAKPGSREGTAILTGHTVHTGGGALDNLENLQVGDRVLLTRSEGDLVYTVSAVTIYNKGTLAAEASSVFTQEGPGRLAVVTCEDWNGSIYLSNVVVIASDPRPVANS
jgi:LPXTG-site transpeptidase (sortase) family protein